MFKNNFNFPKQELVKIDFNLINRYLAYEIDQDYDKENEIIESVVKKIVKRINFFSEEFPFKLAKLEKIIKSNAIFAFGYDIHRRITFYIRPNTGSVKLEKVDYINYMFFILEVLLPILREKYAFSDQINIILNFDHYEADTELIKFIFYYFNSYYPLQISKFHIVNFAFEKLKKNLTFKTEMEELDYFRVT